MPLRGWRHWKSFFRLPNNISIQPRQGDLVKATLINTFFLLLKFLPPSVFNLYQKVYREADNMANEVTKELDGEVVKER